MPTDSHDNKGKTPISLIQSFSYALSGIISVIKAERNMRIHLSATVAVTIMAFYFSISSFEWLCLLLAIGGMLSLELVNSSIERVVDLVTEDYHPLAKQAKDMAAGAVFLFAIITVVMGAMIFLPKIVHWMM
ncbi:MAG: diacylglycerol kinase family protein [Bacillota bacterium]|nr:diacylglycerol kinase family protein [Bacillota bacterium]